MAVRRPGDEHGFTLIELMTVVLVIAILLAIAIPVFTGARARANDRAAQSTIRMAHTAERVHFTDQSLFTEDATVLAGVEPGLNYVTGDFPNVAGRVYLHVHTSTNGELFVSARSKSRRCFYLRDVPDQGVRYASSAGVGATCPMADLQTYTDSW